MKFSNVSSIARNLLFEYPIARVAAQQGLLNVQAFARLIQPEAGKRARKPVKISAIATALSRYLNDYWREDRLNPELKIKSVEIQENKVSVMIDKTETDEFSALLVIVASLVARQVPIVQINNEFPRFIFTTKSQLAYKVPFALRKYIQSSRKFPKGHPLSGL